MHAKFQKILTFRLHTKVSEILCEFFTVGIWVTLKRMKFYVNFSQYNFKYNWKFNWNPGVLLIRLPYLPDQRYLLWKCTLSFKYMYKNVVQNVDVAKLVKDSFSEFPWGVVRISFFNSVQRRIKWSYLYEDGKKHKKKQQVRKRCKSNIMWHLHHISLYKKSSMCNLFINDIDLSPFRISTVSKKQWCNVLYTIIPGQNSNSNHMFGRAIWDKLPKCIFENLEYLSEMWAVSKFSKIKRVIYPKNYLNQICGYWLITPNQKTLFLKTNIF